MDVVKSVAGLYRLMVGGVLHLTDTYVDIDGECEVEGRELVARRIHFTHCKVTIKNITFRTTEDPNGKCLHLEDCEGAELSGCTFCCRSPTTDLAPYPGTPHLAAALVCTRSRVSVSQCQVTAPGLEARGLVVEGGSRVTVTNTTFTSTWNSGVWVQGGGRCRLERGAVRSCGGWVVCFLLPCPRYGALYCTTGGCLEVEDVEQEANPRGCGVFVLHSGSRVNLDRWSGGIEARKGAHPSTQLDIDLRSGPMFKL